MLSLSAARRIQGFFNFLLLFDNSTGIPGVKNTIQMMKYLVIILLFFVSVPVMAQYNPDRVGKKATTLYTKALDKARDGQFKEGIALLKDAIKID